MGPTDNTEKSKPLSKLRVGIIGYGGMGSFHASYLSKGVVPDAELSAVCDVNPARLEAAKTAFGDKVQRFADAEALFAAKAADAVLIATPHYFHPPLVIASLKHKVHPMSEKPAGVYTRQVREMNEAAAKSKCVFGVMFNQRTRPVHIKLKELIDSGELGTLRRSVWLITDWFRTQAYYDSGSWRATWAGEGGGVLINQCPHNLDLWQWYCGVPTRIRAFCGFGKYHRIEVEDDVTAYAEYENGATGVFVTTTGEAPGTNRLEITGDRGKVVLEDNHIRFWRSTVSVEKFLNTCQGGFDRPECWTCDVPSANPGPEHEVVTRRWVEAIVKGTPLVAGGEEGIKSLQISNAMLLSAWTDAWVDIPVDEDLFFRHLQKRIAKSKAGKKAGGRVMDVNGTF